MNLDIESYRDILEFTYLVQIAAIFRYRSWFYLVKLSVCELFFSQFILILCVKLGRTRLRMLNRMVASSALFLTVMEMLFQMIR